MSAMSKLEPAKTYFPTQPIPIVTPTPAVSTKPATPPKPEIKEEPKEEVEVKDEELNDGLVNVPVQWTGGGKLVFVTGNFANNWKDRFKLNKRWAH